MARQREGGTSGVDRQAFRSSGLVFMVWNLRASLPLGGAPEGEGGAVPPPQ
jgi:hypothetical protein